MFLTETIKGKRIQLRAVEEKDAAFILSLRLDPELNKHLNPVSTKVEDQQEWIRNQRIKPFDYYFIIETHEGLSLGAVGLYDIDEAKKTFNWGRWIITKKAPFYVAIETTILIYDTAFNFLKLEEAISDVRLENKNVINFHLSYGAHIFKVDDLSIYYRFPKSDFSFLLNKFKGFHIIKN